MSDVLIKMLSSPDLSSVVLTMVHVEGKPLTPMDVIDGFRHYLGEFENEVVVNENQEQNQSGAI